MNISPPFPVRSPSALQRADACKKRISQEGQELPQPPPTPPRSLLLYYHVMSVPPIPPLSRSVSRCSPREKMKKRKRVRTVDPPFLIASSAGSADSQDLVRHLELVCFLK